MQPSGALQPDSGAGDDPPASGSRRRIEGAPKDATMSLQQCSNYAVTHWHPAFNVVRNTVTAGFDLRSLRPEGRIVVASD